MPGYTHLYQQQVHFIARLRWVHIFLLNLLSTGKWLYPTIDLAAAVAIIVNPFRLRISAAQTSTLIFDPRSTFLTELRLSFQFRSAGFAVQLGIHRLAAFRAEFAIGHRPAVYARHANN